ncbi:hypothetical protein XF_1850 [Xylella fastidiosa 9a5c]|uniref:Transposase n=1 Tax=Xylella fastidiosa (strain 9a5c) TaxID=160492 RepID=Q9PCD1_XYLFA|nr:transposase [Xylella fastidiosa]AAF84656.1 hypothetical protein XF_1850 [Xylella fastidiosa 9a5c]
MPFHVQQDGRSRGEKKLGYAGLCKRLTAWRTDAPVHPLQQSLKDWGRAYANLFTKRADFPRFKKIRYRNSRNVLGTVKNVTVNQSCGKWYVSIQTADEITEPVHPSKLNVEIDADVTQLATQSDGTIYLPVNSFKSRQKSQISVRKDYLHKVTTTISKNPTP